MGNPRVRDSQSLLPRPHHNIAGLTTNKFGGGPQSEYKAMSGYQTDFVGQGKGNARQIRNNIGLPNSNYHKSRSTIQQESTGKKSYQPVPDGRFYTKANFFTLADR